MPKKKKIRYALANAFGSRELVEIVSGILGGGRGKNICFTFYRRLVFIFLSKFSQKFKLFPCGYYYLTSTIGFLDRRAMSVKNGITYWCRCKLSSGIFILKLPRPYCSGDSTSLVDVPWNVSNLLTTTTLNGVRIKVKQGLFSGRLKIADMPFLYELFNCITPYTPLFERVSFHVP